MDNIFSARDVMRIKLLAIKHCRSKRSNYINARNVGIPDRQDVISHSNAFDAFDFFVRSLGQRFSI